MADFKFDIQKQIAVLSENKSGWKKELNIVSWNGMKGKYDLRDWSPDYKRMGKGVTLSENEIDILLIRLQELDLQNKKSEQRMSPKVEESKSKSEDIGLLRFLKRIFS